MNDINPIQYFHKWFCEIRDDFPEVEVNAMALTTVSLDGFPKTRMVLLKQYTWEGFVFYTQYSSEKGKALLVNTKVNVQFPWQKTGRRLSIIGEVEKISEAQSKAYFESRPNGSKIGAWASNQSQPIASRRVLEEDYRFFENKFKGQAIPKPNYWGGYIIKPIAFEFEELQVQNIIKTSRYKLLNEYYWEENISFSTAQKF